MSVVTSSTDGVICSTTDLWRASNPDTKNDIHCLTRGQSIGLTIVTEAGMLSMIAVLFVFYIIFRNLIRRIAVHKWQVFQEPMDVLMTSLFAADLLQALGAVLDVKWINEGKVEIGSYCTAQGIVQQLGETGVAITTCIIAIYTFIGVWWGLGIGSVNGTKLVMVLVWLFVALITLIGNVRFDHRQNRYQAPTPYWCWISQDYLQLRIWGEYFWFWITLLISLVAYVLLYLWSSGKITPNNEKWWKVDVRRIPQEKTRGERRTRSRQSLIMLAYPIVYCICVLPLSIVRWLGFSQESGGRQSHIASAATLSVAAIYSLSGIANVLLFMLTRPNTILFSKKRVEDLNPNAPFAERERDIVLEQGILPPTPQVSTQGRLPGQRR